MSDPMLGSIVIYRFQDGVIVSANLLERVRKYDFYERAIVPSTTVGSQVRDFPNKEDFRREKEQDFQKRVP